MPKGRESKVSKKNKKTLTQDQLQELAEAFELFDRDGDQMIAAAELRVVLMAIGRQMQEQDVVKAMQDLKMQIDPDFDPNDSENDDPELNYEEFILFMTKEILENMIGEEMIEAFKTFGCEDENDTISRVQMGETMVKYGEKMSDEDLEHLYIEADKNGDGRVDFSDFIQMMMSK